MKKVKFNIGCLAVYPSSLVLPDDIPKDKVLDYIRHHLDEANREGELTWLDDLEPNDAVENEDILEDEVFFRTTANDVYIRLLWSANDSYEPNATGTIGIYLYDTDGCEHTSIDGGEMDIYDEGSLTDHIDDVLEFIGLDAAVTQISEEEFANTVSEY
jgi:hypothetical protein